MTQPLTTAAEIVDAYLGLSEVFGDDLTADKDFQETVTEALAHLMQNGAAAAVTSFARD